MDVDSQIRDVASELAARRGQTSFEGYLLLREELSSMYPEDRLKLMQFHLQRLQRRLSSAPVSGSTRNRPRPHGPIRIKDYSSHTQIQIVLIHKFKIGDIDKHMDSYTYEFRKVEFEVL